MWPPTITPCECQQPGWCERHQCWKPSVWHLLCRRQQRYFDAWERGTGPRLEGDAHPVLGNVETITETVEPISDSSEPNLLQKAWNFGKAVVRHTADGARQVDDAVYEGRLTVCRACSSCDIERMVCRDPSCGCYLTVKARWQSENCPLQKWPAVPSVTPPSL